MFWRSDIKTGFAGSRTEDRYKILFTRNVPSFLELVQKRQFFHELELLLTGEYKPKLLMHQEQKQDQLLLPHVLQCRVGTVMPRCRDQTTFGIQKL